MTRKIFLLATFFISLISFHASAQDVDAHSPHPNGGSHQQRNADKKKLKQQEENTRGVEKAKKQHMKLQARNTRKMMRASKRKSAKWNSSRK